MDAFLNTAFSYCILLWPSFLGCVFLALSAAPLGCLMVWLRLGIFGEYMAHTGLLCMVLGQKSLIPGWGWSALIGGAGAWQALTSRTAQDALILGMQGALALGLLLVFLSPEGSAVIGHCMAGNILLMRASDTVILGVLACMSWMFWLTQRKRLIAWIVCEDLARVEGYTLLIPKLTLVSLWIIFFTISLPLTGLFFIVSLLLAPPLSWRPFTEKASILMKRAAFSGVFYVCAGFSISCIVSLPTGPFIALLACTGWGVTYLIALIKRKSLSQKSL